MSLRKIWFVRAELISSEKVTLWSGHTAATYKFSVISLEYDVIFDIPYTKTIGELYARTESILYAKITSIYHQT